MLNVLNVTQQVFNDSANDYPVPSGQSHLFEKLRENRLEKVSKSGNPNSFLLYDRARLFGSPQVG